MTNRIAVFLALLACADAAPAQTRELPDFGSPADSVLSKNDETQLGRQVMLQLRNAGVVFEDPQINEYVRTLGARLAGHANDGQHHFQFFAVDDERINAFALPGGYIGVNSGLILATENESELAGVLAHEVSHVTQRHIARAVYDSQRNSIFSMATMLAAILLGAASDLPGDAIQGAVAASQAAAIQRQINFTRANEYEADRVGMEVLASAGFEPEGMSRFFEKLARRYGIASQRVPELLQTHPVTTDRISEARSRARQLPAVEAVDSVSYGLAKARLRALTARTPEEALAFFEARGDSDLPADGYGKALALMQLGRNDDAERAFRDLAEESPGVIAYRIGQGEALMASGSTEAAIEVYSQAIGLFPRNIPLTISYAEALITAGRPAEAHKLLLDLLNNVTPTPEQIRLIARAANAEGDVGNAYYYMCEYYVSIGNLPLAINQLRLAREAPRVNAIDRARFQARLTQLIEYLPEEQRERQAQPDPQEPQQPQEPRESDSPEPQEPR